MDFRETGLPYDPIVYKAFMTYQQIMASSKPMEPESGPERHFSLQIARALHESKVDDPALLAGAMLTVLPPQTWGMVDRRFGKEVVDLLREAQKHQLSDFAHVMHASDRLKLLTLASGLATFEEYKSYTSKFERGLSMAQMGDKGAEIPVPLFSNLHVFERIFTSLAKRTSNPEMEDLYAEKLDDTRTLQEEQIEKLRAAGLALPPALSGEEATEVVPFEDTGLLDDKAVREVYDIVAHHMNVHPDDLNTAVKVGRLLGATPETRDPVTITAALADISFRQPTDKDWDMLQGSLEWAAMDIIYSHSVHRVSTTEDLLKAPVAFRHIALADAIVILEEARVLGETAKQLAETDPSRPEDFFRDPFKDIRNVADQIARVYQPLMGSTEAPALERIFEESLKRLQKFSALQAPEAKPKFQAKFPPPSPGDGGRPKP